MTWGSEVVPEGLRRGLSASRIPCFDGVRGAAMLLIVATHVKLIPGHVALNIFFGLSGFLITWLLLEEERHQGAVSLWRFYARRSLRIFPAYYVALGVIVWLVPPSRGPLTPDHVQSAALYYSNYYQAVHGATHGAISHFWSLGIEEQFYLLWPGLFLLARRHRAWLLVLLIAAVWWQRFVVCWVEGRWDWAYHALDCRADHVFVGCLVAVCLHEGRLGGLWAWLCARPRRMAWSALTLLLLSIVPAVWGKALRTGGTFYLEPWVVGALILQVVAFADHRSLRWLHWRPLVWLGRVSYAVYLYHLFAMELLSRAAPELSRPLVFLAAVVLSGVFAQVSWVAIESPAQGLRGRLSLSPGASRS